MPTEYDEDVRAHINAAIERFWFDETGDEPGIILRDRIFEFFDQLIGRRAYNQGLADAQAYLQMKMLDMDADLAQDLRSPSRPPTET